MHIKSLMDVINEVLSDGDYKIKSAILREYLRNPDNKEIIEEEAKRYRDIIRFIVYKKPEIIRPEIMNELINYLIEHPDSSLFDAVIPSVLKLRFLTIDKLPAGISTLIDKALRRGYYDKYFVSAKFFDLLSTEGKINALKLLAKRSIPRNTFVNSKTTLHIEYNVYRRLDAKTLENLGECLPFFTFDSESLKSLTLYALDSEQKWIRSYLRLLSHLNRCIKCYNGINGLFLCNEKFYHFTEFTSPEICPKDKQEKSLN